MQNFTEISKEKKIKELKNITTNLFVADYNIKFYKALNSIDESTKHIIQHNKQLNDLYDIFLDFIIDSSRLLDKERE